MTLAPVRSILTDIRFTFRLVRRSPGFAATILLVLVGGMTATTAMFSIVESLLLAPLPYDNPEELAAVHGTAPQVGNRWNVSLADFADWRAGATSFARMAAVGGREPMLTSPGAATEIVDGADVSGEFFGVFRVPPLLGRLIDTDDDRVGAPRVVVISSSLWHRRFASDPAAVGRSLSLDGTPHTVIGVAAEGFVFGEPRNGPVEVWAPISAAAGADPDWAARARMRDWDNLEVVARRQPGVTLAQAQAQMSSISARLAARYPETNARVGSRVVDLHDDMVEDSRSGVLVLFAAIGLVFVAVCANVANLLLTRGAARQGEMGIRAGLGATRGRLVAQLVVETMALFAVATLLSAVLTRTLLDCLIPLLPPGVLVPGIDVRIDGRAFLGCAGAALLCGALFGLVPALVTSQVAPDRILKQSAARAGVSRPHLIVRGVLVVAQVALAFALLASAGLASRAFYRVSATSPGFETSGRVAGSLRLLPTRYPDAASINAFLRDAVAVVSREPGVLSAGVDSHLPLVSGGLNTFAVEGRASVPGDLPPLTINHVSPGYLATMGIPVLRGRGLTDADRAGSRPVMLVSQKVAEQIFPGEDPLGRRITFEDTAPAAEQQWIEIVGIVGDVRRRGLSHPPTLEVYRPVEQVAGDGLPRDFWLVVNTPRLDMQRALPALIAQVDTEETLESVQPLSAIVAHTLRTRRSMALLLMGFSVAALLLAMLGVFGLVSYATAQRTRELALRMALGATPASVVRLVLEKALLLVGLGLALGLVGALALGRVLAAQIPGVASFDPLVSTAVPLVLLATTLLACLLPALRAVRIPPATALRYE